MNIKQILNEIFLDFIKARNKVDYPIYINPTSNDFQELKKETYRAMVFRYILDITNKDLYVFSENLLHFDVKNKVPKLKEKKDSELINSYAMFLPTSVIKIKNSEEFGLKSSISKEDYKTYEEIIKKYFK